MISYKEALSKILSETKIFPTELIPLEQSFGRVLAEPVMADRDYPPFHRSAMDGFAIFSGDFSPNKTYVYEKELPAGTNIQLEPGDEAVRIMTGAPVPDGFDVVIKIEDCILNESNNKKQVSFTIQEVKTWNNIAKQGEDVKKDQLVLPKGIQIGTSEISLLASLGKEKVPVVQSPEVHIISTGSEVVPVHQTPLPYQIRDSNSFTISTFLSKFKIQPKSITHVPDIESKMKDSIKQGLEGDILILSGGVSMGNMDLVPSILQKLGVELIFHKTAIKPGKPIWFGKRNGTIVFGMPGNPFSVQTCSRIFLEPYLRQSFGLPSHPVYKLPFSTTKHKKGSLTEFFPVKLETTNKTYLTPIAFNGSGDIRAGIFSDGLAIFPNELSEIQKEDCIEFLPW
ncbi:molybdopterin molybdenumtransferase MoeA [Leptospira bourretii]|uniref:Molybdopterin molybdenumtransferase n=1 Tax=Leptospira bourretii TaxID=2484962 RepID=A0A4R9IHU0_9LEPT|nr:molybdopterin molybdotransferase MoeA [Leptospira bourretii]TGK88012.1 molybdopterin molybdenumtransferase MoeA [Leptospira bourretii]TGK88662.1 molybdopterin molybdenumtransferase MoeA [Leptospira bourretii]TGL38020.1 molybdopterin molybdenumtransferase MoeA [Leptospira bourretii]